MQEKGYARITDNLELDAPTCEWTASNQWQSVGFEPQDEDDKELRAPVHYIYNKSPQIFTGMTETYLS